MADPYYGSGRAADIRGVNPMVAFEALEGANVLEASARIEPIYSGFPIQQTLGLQSAAGMTQGRASPSSYSIPDGSREPAAKRPKLIDDSGASRVNTFAATIGAGIPKCHWKFNIGDAADYLHLEPTFYGFAWYSVVISSRGQKTIGSKTIPFYVICWPDKDQSISVEEWRLRHPLSTPILSDISNTLAARSYVECLSILETQNGKNLRTWFMGRLTADCKPGTKPQVSYLNTLWNKNNPSVTLERGSVRIIQGDPITELAWREETPPTLLSDEEHLMARFLDDAANICRELQTKAHTLTIDEFEEDRDKLCEIIDSLTNSRHYDKAIALLQFMEEFEVSISRNSKQ